MDLHCFAIWRQCCWQNENSETVCFALYQLALLQRKDEDKISETAMKKLLIILSWEFCLVTIYCIAKDGMKRKKGSSFCVILFHCRPFAWSTGLSQQNWHARQYVFPAAKRSKPWFGLQKVTFQSNKSLAGKHTFSCFFAMRMTDRSLTADPRLWPWP